MFFLELEDTAGSDIRGDDDQPDRCMTWELSITKLVNFFENFLIFLRNQNFRSYVRAHSAQISYHHK